ncbi:MAG: hypothetical protein Q4C98_05560 [Capnocytophaga sp.]|nr:hypothetical protein [Capnocytophaga sp.]
MNTRYITYGIFGENLESYVNDFQHKFHILLEKNPRENEPCLCYEMLEKSHAFIKCFEITLGHNDGYHFAENMILFPNYLIRCNLFYNENTDEDNITEIQQFIQNLPYIKLLNIINQALEL